MVLTIVADIKAFLTINPYNIIMSKYLRTQPIVTRQANDNQEDYWLKEFEKKLAVQPVNQSVFEQINNIMNGKSRYPTVEAAIADMQERSGFTRFVQELDKTSDVEMNETTKMAADVQQDDDKETDSMPVVIKKCPSIKSTLENYVRDTRGNLPVPAIIDKIKSIHRSDVSDAQDWDEPRLLKEVSRLNLEAKKNNPGAYQNYSNLGRRDMIGESEIDPSNRDAFHSLNPVKL